MKVYKMVNEEICVVDEEPKYIVENDFEVIYLTSDKNGNEGMKEAIDIVGTLTNCTVNSVECIRHYYGIEY